LTEHPLSFPPISFPNLSA